MDGEEDRREWEGEMMLRRSDRYGGARFRMHLKLYPQSLKCYKPVEEALLGGADVAGWGGSWW